MVRQLVILGYHRSGTSAATQHLVRAGLFVGDELLSGKTVDTNSAYLAGELTLRGIETVGHYTVGDNEQAIATALAGAAARAPIVLVTGGLGPTKDDLTRQGLAAAMGSELRLDEACVALIRGVRLHLHEYPDVHKAERMLEAIGHHPGSCPLKIQLSGDEFTAELHARRAAISPVPGLLMELAAAAGPECLKLDLSPLSGLVPIKELKPWQKKKARSAAAG